MRQASVAVLPGFGSRLRMLRRVANIKQAVLSAELEIAQSTISRWEAGEQMPSRQRQTDVLDWICQSTLDDHALKRLVQTSSDNVHLIEDVTHKCLAYSATRERDWKKNASSLIGQSLWRFATREIQAAEAALQSGDWWAVRAPRPTCFATSAKVHPELVISAGYIRWERLYLADGTPVRLCTSFP